MVTQCQLIIGDIQCNGSSFGYSCIVKFIDLFFLYFTVLWKLMRRIKPVQIGCVQKILAFMRITVSFHFFAKFLICTVLPTRKVYRKRTTKANTIKNTIAISCQNNKRRLGRIRDLHDNENNSLHTHC